MKKCVLAALLVFILVGSAHAVPMFNNQKPGGFGFENTLSSLDESKRQQIIALRDKLTSEKGVVFAEWESIFTMLKIKHDSFLSLVNANDYEKASAEFETLLSMFNRIKDYARQNPSASSDEAIYFFGIEAMNSYSDFRALPKGLPFPDFILEALKTADERTINQSVSVYTSLFSNMLSSAKDMISATTNNNTENAFRDGVFAIRNDGKTETQVRQEKAIATGKSGGYFSGLPLRLGYALSGVLTWIVISAFVGAIIFRKSNMFMGAVRYALASAICAPVMLILTAVLPFVPQWVLFLAFILGMMIVSQKNFPLWQRFPTLQTILFFDPAAQKDDIGEGLHGSAAWGDKSDMLQKKHVAVEAQDQFAVARIPESGEIFRFMGHMLICAPTGSGKGIGSVIPNLLEYKGSCIVLDVKGENHAVTARRRIGLGHAVYCIDPFGVTGDGCAINPLDRVDLSSPDCVGVALEIAQSLVLKADGGDSHFDDSAESLIHGLILFVKSLAPERQTLSEVRRLLTLPLKSGLDEIQLIDSPDLSFEDVEILMKASDDAQCGNDMIIRAGNSISSKPEKEKGSVISTAQRHTAFLDDPRIIQALGATDFKLSNIKQELMTVFLVMPPAKLKQNARLVRLIVDDAIAAVTSSTAKPEHNIAFFLDEFHMLGYMRQIEESIALLRGYGVSFVIYLQDLSQLKAIYKKWQSFFANCCKVFYGTADVDTAKYVSESLGKKTVEYETEGESSSKGFSLKGVGNKSASTNQHFAGRALLTPDEVMRLGPERPIVLISGERPYQLQRLNYLYDPEYRGLFDPNPFH